MRFMKRVLRKPMHVRLFQLGNSMLGHGSIRDACALLGYPFSNPDTATRVAWSFLAATLFLVHDRFM